jgi:hypothetical protein
MIDRPTTEQPDDFLPRLGVMALVVAVAVGIVFMYVVNKPLMGGIPLNGQSASVVIVPTDRPAGIRSASSVVAGAPGQAVPPPAQAPPVQPQPQPKAPASKAVIPPPAPVTIPQVTNPDPDAANAAAALGNQASQRQDYVTAVKEFSRAMELNSAPIYYGLRGDVYWRMGRLDEALADYDIAIAMEPTAPDGYFGRARVYKDKGDKANAVQDLETFLQLKPNDAGNASIRQQAQEMIASLR